MHNPQFCVPGERPNDVIMSFIAVVVIAVTSRDESSIKNWDEKSK